MDELLLYFNPACSKCAAAAELLRARGVAFGVRNYLEQPLTRPELAELGRRLGLPASAWIRPGGPAWEALGLTRASDESSLLDALAAHPELMQRPIAVRGERAVIGRPPEAVLQLVADSKG